MVHKRWISAQYRQLREQNQVIELFGGKIIVLIGAWKPRDMLGQFRPFVGPSCSQAFRAWNFSTKCRFWADDEVVESHSGDFVEKPISDRLAEAAECFTGVLFLGDFANQLDAGFEQLGRKGNPERSLGEFRILIEELEILAEVEDKEVFLVSAGAEQVGPEPRAPGGKTASPKLNIKRCAYSLMGAIPANFHPL